MKCLLLFFHPVYNNDNRLSPPEYGLKPDVASVSKFEIKSDGSQGLMEQWPLNTFKHLDC